MNRLGYHEISEANHRILNPFSHEKLMLLGEICRLRPGMRQLDLACGKGEMLCQWSKHWQTQGVGVDISNVFLAAARARALELNVVDRVIYLEADAGKYVAQANGFNIVSCLGATRIGGGLTGTLRLMLLVLADGGLLLVGEPFWVESPPEAANQSAGIGRDDFASLAETLVRFESTDMELVEMLLADKNDWDRYVAGQWWTVDDWLRGHAEHADAATVRDWLKNDRRDYLEYGRRYLGWGVFVLRVKS